MGSTDDLNTIRANLETIIQESSSIPRVQGSDTVNLTTLQQRIQRYSEYITDKYKAIIPVYANTIILNTKTRILKESDKELIDEIYYNSNTVDIINKEYIEKINRLYAPGFPGMTTLHINRLHLEYAKLALFICKNDIYLLTILKGLVSSRQDASNEADLIKEELEECAINTDDAQRDLDARQQATRQQPPKPPKRPPFRTGGITQVGKTRKRRKERKSRKTRRFSRR